MILTGRGVLGLGGGVTLLVLRPLAEAATSVTHEIRIRGDATGARVGFDPVGLRIRPGQTIRWTNGDAGNSHTTTAYHPANFGRPRRIPAAATPWDSDYLLPEEGFSVTLTVEGVYDYFCVPHEHAGMVGRIIVGNPDADAWMQDPRAGADLPQPALNGFPPVAEIMGKGIVRRV
jgi:plastocyanin